MTACPRCGGEATLVGRKLVATRRRARCTNGSKVVKSWCDAKCHWPNPVPTATPSPTTSAPAPAPIAPVLRKRAARWLCGPDGERIDTWERYP